ncbi:DUF2721 domain-containing protein [Actomonas aquatica]|uniref:DUF2721 domain-containing protein n=1 Tax=Actomonas aquatica TaxID=2866162 RepID=A0ABZ1C3A7_9BACT|nr:DUF2721 domain-containing protein [Opitutus sp. WL0086]WRQ86080.1 DUF2721 domain-containing protein [Opitutus sp. WL0086]
MTSLSLNDLLPVLQLAIGPVILISGVGLLLLTITNRLGRVVDRARHLAREQANTPAGTASSKLHLQITILNRRAGILRASCMMLALTVLSAAILVLLLFLAKLANWEAGAVVIAVFCIGQLALIGSVIAFMRDINLSLTALRLDLNM